MDNPLSHPNFSNSIEPTNFVVGTNTQQHYVHLLVIKILKVTLTDDEGYRRRLKVTKNELMVISCKLLHSYLVPRYNTISDI